MRTFSSCSHPPLTQVREDENIEDQRLATARR